MEISYIEQVGSTHTLLQNKLKNNEIKPPCGIFAGEQTSGIGSRGNEWVGLRGNLFFSFCIEEKDLPKDLPKTSVCIYFAWIFVEILRKFGSKVWLKWPNDFYVKSLKIGGMMTTKRANLYIVSIGLNLSTSPHSKGILDIKLSPNDVISAFEKKMKNLLLWKQIFSKFRVEFHKSQEFSTHNKEGKLSLKEAKLCEDGSIEINGRRVYNER